MVVWRGVSPKRRKPCLLEQSSLVLKFCWLTLNKFFRSGNTGLASILGQFEEFRKIFITALIVGKKGQHFPHFEKRCSP